MLIPSIFYGKSSAVSRNCLRAAKQIRDGSRVLDICAEHVDSDQRSGMFAMDGPGAVPAAEEHFHMFMLIRRLSFDVLNPPASREIKSQLIHDLTSKTWGVLALTSLPGGLMLDHFPELRTRYLRSVLDNWSAMFGLGARFVSARQYGCELIYLQGRSIDTCLRGLVDRDKHLRGINDEPRLRELVSQACGVPYVPPAEKPLQPFSGLAPGELTGAKGFARPTTFTAATAAGVKLNGASDGAPTRVVAYVQFDASGDAYTTFVVQQQTDGGGWSSVMARLAPDEDRRNSNAAGTLFHVTDDEWDHILSEARAAAVFISGMGFRANRPLLPSDEK